VIVQGTGSGDLPAPSWLARMRWQVCDAD